MTTNWHTQVRSIQSVITAAHSHLRQTSVNDLLLTGRQLGLAS